MNLFKRFEMRKFLRERGVRFPLYIIFNTDRFKNIVSVGSAYGLTNEQREEFCAKFNASI